MKALDDLTLEITLERPLNSFDRTIAVRGLYPLRQDFVEQVCRIRVTHPGVTAEGIVNKMEVNELRGR